MIWIIFSLIIYLIGAYIVFALFTWYDTDKYNDMDVGLNIIFSMMWPFLAITTPISVPFYFIYKWINNYKKNKS
jgi:hypothetical protein